MVIDMRKIKTIFSSADTPKTDVGIEVQRAPGIEDLIKKRTPHALITRIHEAVLNGTIKEPFTAHDIEDWMERDNIRQADGSKYSSGYPSRLLSQSCIEKQNTTNGNSIWLDRRKNKGGLYEYWFI